MTALVVPSQTAALAAAGIVAPKVAEFIPGVPLDGLVEVWRARSGLTLVGGKASAWTGYNGGIAQQADAAKRPAASTAQVDFSGSGDYLTTALTPPVSGYLVARVRRKAVGTFALIAGSHQATSAPAQRLSIGLTSTNTAGAQIGAKAINAFSGIDTFAADAVVTIGVAWAGGTARLRVNGAQVATSAYDTQTGGVAAGVGSAPFWLGGANQGTLNGESSDQLLALALYSGNLVDAALAQIDAGMGAF